MLPVPLALGISNPKTSMRSQFSGPCLSNTIESTDKAGSVTPYVPKARSLKVEELSQDLGSF